MSFRRGLILFVLAIVVVPLVVVGVLLARVAEDSANGKADARLAAGLQTAKGLYEEALQGAPGEAERIAAKAADELGQSGGDGTERIAADEASGPAIASVTILDGDGRELASSGPDTAIATAASDVRTSGGPVIGTVRVTTLAAEAYVTDVNRLTGQEALLADQSGQLASSTDQADLQLPDPGAGEVAETELGGEAMRAADLELGGEPGGVRVIMLVPQEAGFLASEPAVAAILIIFLALAALLILLLLRNLRRRVATMLDVARKIGSGDFGDQVPVDGDDEMAGLAREFNRMSERLSSQMSELHSQRRMLEESVQRIGEALATGLDRRHLVELVLETAVSACSAETGRVVLVDRLGVPEIVADGDTVDELDRVLKGAGATATQAQAQGIASDGDRHAIAQATVDPRNRAGVLFTLAVARRGDSFTAHERETLRYLLRQTAVSIENIGLQERVASQAVTDGLTGLSNHRHFSGWIEREVARLRRFGGELSLLIMDIDNFKLVNDTYGHLRGDRVLEEVGRVLRSESRAIDEVARYGGEEFVLALPETGSDGAMDVAERVRNRIAATRVPGGNGGQPLSVTVSIGVATMPHDGETSRELIAAADAALYRAKQQGKNRAQPAAGDAVASRRGTAVSGE